MPYNIYMGDPAISTLPASRLAVAVIVALYYG